MAIHFYEDAFTELQEIARRWKELPRRTRNAVLVMVGVIDIPGKGPRRWRAGSKRGESPQWMLPAMNILKDSDGFLTDREIAQRVGIAQSTLSRNKEFQHAKKTYLQQVRKVVRKNQFKKKV